MNTPEAQEAGEQEEYCDNCGRVMVLRRGPFGMFMSCPGFNEDPPCKTFRKLSSKQQQKVAAPKPTGEDCPQCGKPLVLRQGSYGEFVSCSGYPKCKYVKQNLIEGLKCPKCGTGDLAERKARRGNIFWGCTNYPKCDFTSNSSRSRRSARSAAAPTWSRRRSVGNLSGMPEQEKERRGRGCSKEAGEESSQKCGQECSRIIGWRRCCCARRTGCRLLLLQANRRCATASNRRHPWARRRKIGQRSLRLPKLSDKPVSKGHDFG